MGSRVVVMGGALAAITVLNPAGARADTGNVVAAEALFRAGKELLARQDFARACPKLEESFRLDPATGTLLALAICNEREGKTASAWGEYSDVAARSRAESRPDREKAARDKAAELEPHLSTLTVLLGDGAQAPGLEIRRNGTLMAPAWMGTPLPVNGGTEIIEASAPGKKTWHWEVSIDRNRDHQSVTIPPLQDGGVARETEPGLPQLPVRGAAQADPATDQASAEMVAVAPVARAPSSNSSGDGSLTPTQVTGVAVGLLGAAGLGVGTYFGVTALNRNNHALSQSCTAGDLCTPAGRQERSDAVAAGDVSTAFFVGGAVFAVVGVTMVFLGHRMMPPTGVARSTLQALPLVDAHGIGGVLQGSF